MNQSYCYSFRFCCDPGFNDRREIASLRRFVREAQIDDVAVFCNVEELNTGHMTEEEQETIWLRLLCDVQAALAPEGVQLSVNHWHSLMHADLGKTLPAEPAVPPHGRHGRPGGRSVRLPDVRTLADLFCRALRALRGAFAAHSVGGGRFPPA